MDKLFWQEIIHNEYAIPDGHKIDELITELFSYLGSTDPELRDDIGYTIYATWLKKGMCTHETIEYHISQLLSNLEVGIGERDTDSVFLRSFSVLFLAEIIHNDNKTPKLKKATIDILVERALSYLEKEKDPRGFIPVKGWAHVLAHTADLFCVLAKNKHTDGEQHLQILNGIIQKLISATDWVYTFGEDDRLSAAALSVFQRGTLNASILHNWISSFTGNWKGAWMNEERTRAFFNVRNFTRSLYIQLITVEELEKKEGYEKVMLEAIQGLRTW